MPDPQLTPEPKVKVSFKQNSLTGESYIDTAQLKDLKAGDTVVWNATSVNIDHRMVLPDDRVFGVDSFTLKKGESVTMKVGTGLQPGLQQDYVIFCLKTYRKVKSNDGVEPSIIIGG